jgi:hypothetical protein
MRDFRFYRDMAATKFNDPRFGARERPKQRRIVLARATIIQGEGQLSLALGR